MRKQQPKYCLSTRSHKTRRIFIWVLSSFSLCFFTGVAIDWYTDYPDVNDLMLPSLVLVFGISISVFFAFANIVDSRKYSIDQKGITISYIGGYTAFYPWNTFPKIVVCDYDHVAKNPIDCKLIIRLGPHGEFCGPLSRNKRYNSTGMDSWRGYFYTTFHPKEIICLSFSPARLEEIQQLSKLQVLYSFTKYGKKLYEERMQDGSWNQ